MTNFFQHQVAARRRTTLLVVYFVLAIIVLVGLSYFLVTAVFFLPSLNEDKDATWWMPGLLVLVTVAVLMLVGGCTVYKVAQLSSGGHSVALLLGGKEIIGQTRDLRERRLLNVVEEMAIAAGLPVPPVYVMEDEHGINAFAAGYSPGDAIVAVSRGSLEYLSRDELQGVIGHEFSHILNGDMRLNIRLIAIVFGIMGIAVVGEILMRSSNGSSSKKGGGQIAALGLGLFVLGWAGAFFGNLIKAAVSRQREFLADASSVQFTRNPDGIGGALKKIGGLAKGPNLDNANATEVSHMCFADALLKQRFMGLFDTHPPLGDRIRRVDSNWDGEYPEVKLLSVTARDDEARPARLPPFDRMPTVPGMPQLPLPVLAATADETVGRIGKVTPAQVTYAADLSAGLPDQLREAVSEPFSARAAIYCLLLDPSADIRGTQLARLQAEADPRDSAETQRLAPMVSQLPDAARLPLIDLAMPTLRRMSPAQHEVFRRQVDQLTKADLNLSVFEYVLACVLERYLDARFGRKPVKPAALPLQTPTPHVVSVLSLLAWEGNETEETARQAFDAGMRQYMRGANPHELLPRKACSVEQLDQRLRLLATTTAGAKRRILLACVECITFDRKATVREVELYRAIGDVLGVPVPPLA